MGTPFSLEDIDRAHQGVTQETVRKYLTDLYALGVVSYTTHISDGHSEYFDTWIRIQRAAARRRRLRQFVTCRGGSPVPQCELRAARSFGVRGRISRADTRTMNSRVNQRFDSAVR